MANTRYINAAFRSSDNNEAYLFLNDNQYVVLDYAPGTGNDKLLFGPTPIRDGFKSLANTVFGTYGVECAFDTDNTEAFIFNENICALIDYAPDSRDKIISGPKNIADMFPFLKGTVFERGIDTAYRSSKGKEVYLFKEDQYAVIDYGANSIVDNRIRKISDGFPCLRRTLFERELDAAFASHKTNSVYFFKGDYYTRATVTPGATDDQVMDGERKTLDYWPSLRGVLN